MLPCSEALQQRLRLDLSSPARRCQTHVHVSYLRCLRPAVSTMLSGCPVCVLGRTGLDCPMCSWVCRDGASLQEHVELHLEQEAAGSSSGT